MNIEDLLFFFYRTRTEKAIKEIYGWEPPIISFILDNFARRIFHPNTCLNKKCNNYYLMEQ